MKKPPVPPMHSNYCCMAKEREKKNFLILGRYVSPVWPGPLCPRALLPWKNVVSSGVLNSWRTPDVLVLPQNPDAVLCCLGCLNAFSKLILDGRVWGGLGEASGVSVALFLPIILVTKFQLPCLCISTLVSRTSHSVFLSVSGATDSQLCSKMFTDPVFPQVQC